MEICKDCGASDVPKYPRGDSKGFYYKCKCGSKKKPIETDEEIIRDNVRLAKQKQALQDKNRIANKSFREHARYENAMEAYSKAVFEELRDRNYVPHVATEFKGFAGTSEVGVIQWSDWHLNELINLKSNKYDFYIASQRVKAHVNEAILVFKGRGISKVLVAVTGDMLNSDRRLDEKLNQATNRARATILAQELVTNALLDLAGSFAKVSVVSVLGNEGRADQEMTFSEEGLSNNYDYTIVAMSKAVIEAMGVSNIHWGSIDKVEEVVEVNGQNILLCHDVTKETSTQAKTQSLYGRYAMAGTVLSMVLAGHIHATRITDLSMRSSSLAGSNSFNEVALGLAGMASQDLLIVGKNYIHKIAVDLQGASNEGYPYSMEVRDCYNTKSKSKLKGKTTVFKVVI